MSPLEIFYNAMTPRQRRRFYRHTMRLCEATTAVVDATNDLLQAALKLGNTLNG